MPSGTSAVEVQNETVCLCNVVYDWLLSYKHIHYMCRMSVSHKGKATIPVCHPSDLLPS